MSTHTTRRRFLTSTTTTIALAAALAGCTGGGSDDDDTGDEAGPSDDIDYENPDGSVSFVSPADGDEVTSPVSLEMETDGVVIEPAAEGQNDGHGHFHVLVDVDCLEPGEYIPFEDGYNHFGDGSLEGELDLEPGTYDLCLQVADGGHYAYALTDEITITVTE
ncbi:DUF4399 domain-containing protein [Natronobiforma cellulositropha]|uniref:DUF4399 domain-containing protein n=1 Tax=Natronobiforma cellulositropha TaxID=1679076 RepID=UPI0021D59BD6|nr:DUF4399 domain-containing protein [Natronobiforma cellulositropha]